MSNPSMTENQCLRCNHGRMQAISKPYLHFYRGQLFTIADAMYYECDVCNDGEFDDLVFDVIGMMVHHAFSRSALSREDEPTSNSQNDSPSVPPATA